MWEEAFWIPKEENSVSYLSLCFKGDKSNLQMASVVEEHLNLISTRQTQMDHRSGFVVKKLNANHTTDAHIHTHQSAVLIWSKVMEALKSDTSCSSGGITNTLTLKSTALPQQHVQEPRS